MSTTATAAIPDAPRRVAVLGAGAVGTLLGGLLAASGSEVTLLDPRVPDAGDEIVIHEPDGRRVVVGVRRAGSPAELAAPPDLALLAVKTFDLAGALDDLRAWPATPVLTIQNGVGAEDLVAAARPGIAHAAGSLTAPVERAGPQEVRWRGRGGIGLAPVSGAVDGLLADLADAFTGAGLPARRIADARAMKWSKLLANLVGNALSALADRDPAEIYADPALFDLERRQLLEALAVMRALGVRPVALPGANVPLLAVGVRLPRGLSRFALRRVVVGARGGKSPSLRLHLRGGAEGPSEVAWLNGAVARAGAAHGVPTPVNTALAALVDSATGDPVLAAGLAADPARILELVADGGRGDAPSAASSMAHPDVHRSNRPAP